MSKFVITGGRAYGPGQTQWAPLNIVNGSSHDPNPPILVEHYVAPPAFRSSWSINANPTVITASQTG